MTDAATRELEKRLDGDGSDQRTRSELTRARLRAMSGIVAWWAGQESPHPSASRVVLTYTCQHPTQPGVSHTWRHDGWALGVAGVEDYFELARLARSATFLDLATGEWLRASARRTGHDLNTLGVREEPTTLDALGLPRATVKRSRSPRVDEDRRVPSGSGSPLGGLAGYVVEEPIYDSEWRRQSSPHHTVLFQNFYQFSDPEPDLPIMKQWGIDCNLAGGGGGLPQGTFHDVSGVTVWLMDRTRRLLPRDQAERIAAGSTLALEQAQARFLTLPLLACVQLDDDKTNDGEASAGSTPFTIARPTPPVFPLAFPLELRPLEHFQVRIQTDVSVPDEFLVRVALSGFNTRARFG